MIRALFGTAVAVSLFIMAPQARAQNWNYSGGYGAYQNHERHHDDLDHRAYHRDVDHRDAHRYPMTWRQHDGLHNDLNHEAFHDRVEHRSAHRSGAYYPYSGFGYNGRGVSIWFGR